ncbi:hypothetical protein [Neolewinella persica]|uniref:hypothetical protein n=1 Tax=Neolewinella persica TaxID=70998 RepID=UPI00035DEF0D|nr:hypothetical protein [Neolewinella persica]
MKIRNRHLNKIQEVSFYSWFYSTMNKEDYIVIELGDLVYWQIIDEGGRKRDYKITDRKHAIRMITADERRNSLRELNIWELADLKICFFDSGVLHEPTEINNYEETSLSLSHIATSNSLSLTVNELLELISSGQVEKAIAKLNENLKEIGEDELWRSIVHLSSRYKRVSKLNSDGLIDLNSYSIEVNQITSSLIGYISNEYAKLLVQREKKM